MSDHHAETPLARRLRAQAEAARADLGKAAGLSRETFDGLLVRADALIARIERAGGTPAHTEPVRARRRIIAAVTTLLSDPAAAAPPPSNAEIYAAALDITELAAIAEAVPAAPLLEHMTSLAEGHPGAAAERLRLGFAALCKRAKLSLDADRLDLRGWPVAITAEAGHHASLVEAARAASDALASRRMPGLLLVEVGSVLPPAPPIRVASDADGIAAAADRVDRLLLETHADVVHAVDTDHAFALVAHATLPATNAASGRVLFADLFRAISLIDERDPRGDKLHAFMSAISGA